MKSRTNLSTDLVISYAIKGEYKKILNIVNNLLSTIKELQSAEKDSIIKS